MPVAAAARTIGAMTTVPATSRVPAGAVLLAGLGAQLVDDAVFFVLPPTALLAPLTGLLAILLTAGAARIITRNRTGAVVARTGLAVGLTSAVIGLLVSGLGLVTILLAGVTVLAGVAGAVARRGLTKNDIS
ncbi:MAG: hypothetical protein JWR58_4646 [Pseudonocardia sp.]|jgi:hypothetical protein|nr:hypothetical protein [Pseudonocardia sp.]